jgi:tight adherence protein C
MTMPQWMAHLSPSLLAALALALLALAVLLLGSGLLWRAARQARSRITVDEALARRQARYTPSVPQATDDIGGRGWRASMTRLAAAAGQRWQEGRFGGLLLAPEDRVLLEMGGFRSQGTANALFLFARVVLCLGLMAAAVLWTPREALSGHGPLTLVFLAFLGFAIGWMLPKWVVAARVARRKAAAAEELPLLIDLLRLLQGVGLSMDQSLHVVVTEFIDVMPVLTSELSVAVDQYTRGRTREQSLERLSSGFENDDLSAICRLIAQVDQHGGAVQEPLQRFGERLREQRRMELKEKVGKLTVKMTGVMVLTLLPALLIVTAGSGFIAVFRGLSRLGGHG